MLSVIKRGFFMSKFTRIGLVRTYITAAGGKPDFISYTDGPRSAMNTNKINEVRIKVEQYSDGLTELARKMVADALNIHPAVKSAKVNKNGNLAVYFDGLSPVTERAYEKARQEREQRIAEREARRAAAEVQIERERKEIVSVLRGLTSDDLLDMLRDVIDNGEVGEVLALQIVDSLV